MKLRELTAFSVLALAAGSPAFSQPDYAAFKPDPANVRFVLPADIPWKGEAGKSQTYMVKGDPAKPGPYVMLLKWWPGQFSYPHFHEKTRYFTVVSGTWWMSSSPIRDISKTYPLPAGTVVVHEAGKVHWDGAKDEPAVIMIAGEGPVSNISVDEDGHAAPSAPQAPGAPPGPPLKARR